MGVLFVLYAIGANRVNSFSARSFTIFRSILFQASKKKAQTSLSFLDLRKIHYAK